MPVDIAIIEYSNDFQGWRLFSPRRDKMSPLPPGWEGVRNVNGLAHVNRLLRSWGYRIASEGWGLDGPTWVVVVQRLEPE